MTSLALKRRPSGLYVPDHAIQRVPLVLTARKSRPSVRRQQFMSRRGFVWWNGGWRYSPRGGTGWTKVQSFLKNTDYTSTNVLQTAAVLSSAVAVGDVVLLQAGNGTQIGQADPSLIQDQLGNTWSIASSAFDTVNHEKTYFCYCIITHAGTPTITFTPNAGNQAPWQWLQGDHFTGSDASSVIRSTRGAQVQTNPGTGTDAIKSGSTINAQSGDLLWGASNDSGNGPGFGTEVHGTGFTAGAAMDATTGALTEYLTATGSSDVTFTDATNGGGDVFMTGGMAVSPAGGGTATPAPRPEIVSQAVSRAAVR